MPQLPMQPPFVIRARLVSPLADGRTLHELDGVVAVDADGRIERVDAWSPADASASAVDLRPMVVLPGLVDLHVHLPQLPNAGLGAGMDLLSWLERYIFPLERLYDRETAEAQAPAAFGALAAAGTTTVVAYAALWPESTDAAFAAAEAHGIRAVIGKVMMDRLTYDADIAPGDILETSLSQTDALATRWHGRDGGRLRYAVTPRFAVSCTADLLRESAALAAAHGAYWQTHLSEDLAELGSVRTLFPDARDYLDVYDRAGALTDRAILAHAIHLSGRELARVVDSGAAIAHCPASNLFLASGLMPLAEYLAAGAGVGLGSDVAAGPELSIFSVMRAGAMTQQALVAVGRGDAAARLRPSEWLRLATIGGARCLGMDAEIGSVEVGKEADLIVVDPSLAAPLPEAADDDAATDVDALLSRLMFRPHPEMVRAAWVRGRLLAGPPGVAGIG